MIKANGDESKLKAFQQQSIKKNNQNFLLSLLKKNRAAMTKKELSEESKLSVVTINKLIPDLVDSRKILPLEAPLETGGRRATAYKFNEQLKLFLVTQFIEINKKFVTNFFIVDLFGQILEKEQIEMITLSKFIEKVTIIKKRYPAIQFVITGIPGVEVNQSLKIMDYPPFRNIDLNQEIIKHVNIESMVENDINAASLGFAKEADTILSGVYFPIAFPPGAALILNQKIFHGFNNLSGEIQHLPTLKDRIYPLKSNEIQAAFLETLQSLIATYDPQKIIAFFPYSWNKLIHKDQLMDSLRETFNYNVLPEIIFSQDFSACYSAGLIKLGLQKMEKLASFS